MIDGDTISTGGQTVRLVGFDSPEGGINARCDAERTLTAVCGGGSVAARTESRC
jgi:endonuclease YncB( thermonuclease family)